MDGNNLEYITLEIIADIVNLHKTTIKIYLDRPEFAKYRKRVKLYNYPKIAYVLNEQFIIDLCDFFNIKHKENCILALKNFWRRHLKEKNKNLEKTLDLTNKHYEGLLQRYNEVLEINKKYRIIYKKLTDICEEQADNIGILNLQNRIKKILEI